MWKPCIFNHKIFKRTVFQESQYYINTYLTYMTHIAKVKENRISHFSLKVLFCRFLSPSWRKHACSTFLQLFPIIFLGRFICATLFIKILFYSLTHLRVLGLYEKKLKPTLWNASTSQLMNTSLRFGQNWNTSQPLAASKLADFSKINIHSLSWMFL